MKVRRIIVLSLIISVLCVFTAGCTDKKAEEKNGSVKQTVTLESNETTDKDNTGGAEEKSTAKMPITKNDSGKTLIQRVSTDKTYSNTFMITSKSGTVVIADPYTMPDGIIKSVDTICSTHTHYDHVDAIFSDQFNCKKSLGKAENFKVKDISITSIASSHDDLEISPENPTNVIYIFEVDGLRIAHMGDIGQESLTDEQIKQLGKIDIAFMQFENSYSNMSLENEKGLKLIEQLKPQIIIPTHSSADATKKIGEIAGKLETVENIFEVSKDDLKDSGRKVIDLINTLY
ncbi:MAG: MBL fold metallo-hydrolase [Clostridia bacterium]|nr:MBL fold metallo-hydrolase [Clostridia bacterium]